MGKNAIVGQSGGPTSVINASLAGVFQACQSRGAEKVYGMANGIAGLLEGRVIDLSATLRSSLEIGDEIITIGGIVGKVVKIREEDIVIETGTDRVKMRLQRWAVNTNVTKTEQHKKEVEAARAAAKDKKDKKSSKEDKITEKSETAKEAEKKIEE